MKRVLTLLILLLAGMAPGAVRAQTGNAALRAQLESVYERHRAAIAAEDYDALVAIIDPAADRVPTREEFRQEISRLKEFVILLFLPVAAMRFVTIDEHGEWAAYYAVQDPSAGDHTTVVQFRFRRVEGRWRLAPTVESTTFNRIDDGPALLERIRGHAPFRLPGTSGG